MLTTSPLVIGILHVKHKPTESKQWTPKFYQKPVKKQSGETEVSKQIIYYYLDKNKWLA